MKKNLLLKFHKHLLKACCGIALFLAVGNGTYAQLPTGFSQKKLTDNVINEATALAHAPDGRIFIAERGGNVKVFQNGTLTTVHTAQTVTEDEQGMLGITLHPQFATNGKFYIFYTNTLAKPNQRHYIDAISINANNQVTAVNRVMELDSVINGAHNGGAILFKQGFLYVAVGESNSASWSPRLDTYRGKILRLTEDGQPAPGNPYYDTPGANRQQRSIWARGLRNPWKMALDPASQKIFVIDVGGDYEEINDVTNPDASKGYNYGWNQDGKSGSTQAAGTITGAYYYDHSDDKGGCAITSGVFFNPPATNYPAEYRNKFFFSDWCRDWYRFVDVNNLTPASQYTEFAAKGFGRILGTSVGNDGNIYYIQYGTNGSLWRIEYNNNQAPTIVNQPANVTVTAGDQAQFSVSASGGVPMSFQWQKNGVDIAGATNPTYAIAQTTAADSGLYRCVVTNHISSVTSNAAKLTILPFNARPVPHILTPAGTVKWSVGTVVSFSGSATDAEDGTLPASAYKWELRFYHKDTETSEHWHPGPTVPAGIKSGTFTADNLGESSPNIWFRLMLTVTDSNGRTGVDSVDLYPNKVNVTAASNINGIQLVLGKQATSPFTKPMVVNASTTLQAITPQIIGDTTYEFVSWRHGGDTLQSIRVPSVDSTFFATYRATGSRQNPFPLGSAPATIPGKIEIEDFDLGGEGIAYHDNSTANQGNQYRANEGVDLENCSEGGFNIGYVNAGEWLEYTANVTVTGKYTFAARVANPGAAKSLRVTMDGQDITGAVAVPTTGGFQAWQTVSVTTSTLPAGVHVFRIELNDNDFNVNYFTFALAIGNAPTVSITAPASGEAFESNSDLLITATAADTDGTVKKVEFFQGATKLGEDTTSPYQYLWTAVPAGSYSITAKATDNTQMTATSTPVSINVTAAPVQKNVPGRIEAEDYDAMDGIGTEGTADVGGGENIGWVGTGDWMDYNVNVAAAGTYNVALRVASAPGGGQLQLRSGTNVLTTVDVEATGGWQSWVTKNTTVTLNAGRQTIRVYASKADFNLNWFEFTTSSATGGKLAVHEPGVSVVKIYPNPVVDLLTVGNVKGDGLFTITNVSTSQTTTIKAVNGVLDVSKLTPGVYVLQFTNNGKPVVKKFVKM